MRDEHRLPRIAVEQFAVDVLQASAAQPVWILFSADWCVPCRLLEPQLFQLMQTEGVRVFKCDVDHEPELAARFQVQSLPVVKCFLQGQVRESFAGVVSNGRLRETAHAQLRTLASTDMR